MCMSSVISDQELLEGLRSAMKSRKVSVRALSERLGVPYRTLQNYLTGQTRLPAATFLSACNALGLDQHFVMTNSFELSGSDMYDAVLTVLNDVLPLIDAPSVEADVKPRLTDKSDSAHRQVAATVLAIKLSKAYDKYRRDTWKKEVAPSEPRRAGR